MRRLSGWPYEDTFGGYTPSQPRPGEASERQFSATGSGKAARPAATRVAMATGEHAALPHAARRAPNLRGSAAVSSSSRGQMAVSSAAQPAARRRTTTGTFAAYKTQTGNFTSVAAASGEYIGFKTPPDAERESDVSWRVVEAEYRASRLSLPNLSLYALAASTRAKLSGLGPRFELMAAGCIAALAGYGVTAWTCDMSAAKARAARSGEHALTGAAVAPALEVARAATWALANPDVSAATTLVSAAATEPPRAVIAGRATQAQRGRRNASATGAKPSVASRATGSAARTSQAARSAAGRQLDVAPAQPDLIAMAVADKRAPAAATGPAADEVAPMRPEDWRELALLVAPAESAHADAPARAELAVPKPHAAEMERSPDPDAVPHAAEAVPAPNSPAAAAPSVPLGTFQAAPVARRAVLQNIEVRGPLPKSIIRRSLVRLEGDFSQCAPICARNAEACGTGHWHAETVLDEAGRSRDPHVSGPAASSQMSECITKATSRLAILAPDTGTVRVSWDVKFTP